MENKITKNYAAEFFKNRGTEAYTGFFVADNDSSIKLKTKEVAQAQAALEKAREELEKEYSSKYRKEYVPTTQQPIFEYRTPRRPYTKYWYNAEGESLGYNPIEDDEEHKYVLIDLPKKSGSVSFLMGYCYELGSVIGQSCNYNVSADYTKCTFKIYDNFLIPIFDTGWYSRNGYISVFSTSFSADTLEHYNATEFLNGFYGIKRKFDIDLQKVRDKYRSNPAFEVIVKTAPNSLMRTLLDMVCIEKSMPVYKILGITESIYNTIVEKGIELDYYALKKYISQKEIFNKTEEEWIDLIEEVKRRENDLDFFHIEYSSYYFLKDDPSKLLRFLASSYLEYNGFQKYYSFGKFINYVIEESINQGYTHISSFISELRDYLRMCEAQRIVPTLYSSYLKQTHDIATRNHKVYLDTHQEEIFNARYEGFKPVKIKKGELIYQILAPQTSDEVKKEGDALNHCVASYIKRILDGTTQIFFLRKDPLESLITLEVREGKICQARGMHNRRPTDEENSVIEKFAEKKSLQIAY